MINHGDIIFCLKGFYFKTTNIYEKEEDRLVYSHSKGIELRFSINTRHMYGNSSLYNTFTGHRFVACLLLVKNIGSENKKLVLDCTPIALGAGFVPNEYKTPYKLKYGWNTFGRR